MDKEKFEIGDVVELIEMGNCSSAEIGATAIVIGNREESSDYLDVVWNDDKAHSQSDGGYYKRSFRIVKKGRGEIPLNGYIAVSDTMDVIGKVCFSPQRALNNVMKLINNKRTDPYIAEVKFIKKIVPTVKVVKL